jgi:hypothetical protein
MRAARRKNVSRKSCRVGEDSGKWLVNSCGIQGRRTCIMPESLASLGPGVDKCVAAGIPAQTSRLEEPCDGDTGTGRASA